METQTPQGSVDNVTVAQAFFQYWNTLIQNIGLSLVQLLLHCLLLDFIPSQPIFYKPHRNAVKKPSPTSMQKL